MRSINAISCAPAVKEWLTSSHQPRILHIFDHVCNLINERRDVLSIVTPQIGNGPFNLVLADEVCFCNAIDTETPIVTFSDQLALGILNINMANTRSWDPRPKWERLHSERDHLFKRVSQLRATDHQVESFITSLAKSTNLQSLLSAFSAALAQADLPSARKFAAQLAGLGFGLTPAGDDVLMGAMYATWITHPAEVAGVLLQETASSAAPLTTSLSAAWLRSAGRGEAGNLWHRFFDALLSSDAESTQSAADKILAVGHTSGADALAGFLSTMAASIDLT